MKIIRALALAAVAFAATAQQTGLNRFQAIDAATPSAAAEALTVQQPAANAKQLVMETADAFCSVTCTVTFSWNGTAATATTLAIQSLPGGNAAPVATAWSGSNVGSGTTGKTFTIPAGGTMAFDLSAFILGNTGSATNLTMKTNSITGTVRLTMQWREL